MEHHNCILDISKLLAKTHETLIEQICKELNAEDRVEELVKKYISNDFSKLKPKKDPNMPKKPKSGYMFFCDEHRRVVMTKNKSAKMGEISKILGNMWKKMDEEEKKPYMDQAEEAKEEYTEALKDYKANN
jgi:ABC-type transporter MlaC component